MKPLALLLLLALPAAAAAQHGGMAGMDMPPASPAGITVRVDSAAHAVYVTAGPFDVEGMSGDEHSHMMHDRVIRWVWPVDGYLNGFKLGVQDSAGAALAREYLHHAGIALLNRRELLLPEFMRLIAGGKETAEVQLPGNVGVPLHRGDSLALYVGLHNPQGMTRHGAYITLRLPYVTAHGQKIVAVWPVTFEVNFHSGGTSAFDLAPGRTVRTKEFTMPVNGRLLAVGGHLHDYATSIGLQDCRSGKTLVQLTAHRGRDGRIAGVDRFIYGYNGDALPLERGRCYRIVAVYDNPTGIALPLGGMASMAGPLEVLDADGWPILDAHDVAFVEDGKNL